MDFWDLIVICFLGFTAFVVWIVFKYCEKVEWKSKGYMFPFQQNFWAVLIGFPVIFITLVILDLLGAFK